MKNKSLPLKKIDITSLKVIDKKNLTSIYGGSAAPQVFTSFFSDNDKGGFCSLGGDIDS